VGEILADNPRGVLVFRDELVGWLAKLDDEENQGDRAFYLETWTGTGSYTWDRIQRGTVHVANACLAVLGGIQPAKLQAYLYNTIHGLQNDGLLQRFQLLVYPDDKGAWKIVDRKPDQDAQLRAYRIFERLANADFEKWGAQTEEHCKQPFFHFDDEAQELFFDWWTQLETVTLPGEPAAIMKEHLSKYRSLVPSIALLIHLVERADSGQREHGSDAVIRVPASAVKRAIGWCDYLQSHARRIYGLAQDYRTQAAAALATQIRNGKLEDGFSTRDVYRKGWSGLTDPEVALAACRELEAAGWLRTRPLGKAATGRPAGQQYEINPKARRTGDGADRAREAPADAKPRFKRALKRVK
jgi:Protein of unknown function (DUF3987)